MPSLWYARLVDLMYDLETTWTFWAYGEAAARQTLQRRWPELHVVSLNRL